MKRPVVGDKKERAVLVGLTTRDQDELKVQEYLDELAFLAETAGAELIRSFVQRADKPYPATFVGTGKLAEIGEFVSAHAVDLVIFDDELSPTQLRNIERQLTCKVLDRTNLILDIFARRARTSYARTQVELAQYQYLLPRLTRMWTHLERQQGGIGLRGPGETEIETDRRIIRNKITRLKAQLRKIDMQMSEQRKSRGGIVRVALVGYTNVGKSTLMNLLSKSEVFAENKLFATLDTTVRKVVVGNLPFLLADTVGFIRKLPHHLVESFKSTLDEVREADILMHVVDISHPGFEDQIRVVRQTLLEIQAVNKVVIMVFNKVDAYRFIKQDDVDIRPDLAAPVSLQELQQTWMARQEEPCLFVSATERTNLELLREVLYEQVRNIHSRRYPYDHYLY